MIAIISNRLRIAILAGVASTGLSGCLGDAEMWEGVAMGLNMAADDLAAENHYRAQCYPASLSGLPGSNPRYPGMLCPGDYGYHAVYVTPVAYGDHHHRRDRGHGGHRDKRDRKHRH